MSGTTSTMAELSQTHSLTAEDEEEKAERAKEFMNTLKRTRPSRKRYSIGARAAPVAPGQY